MRIAVCVCVCVCAVLTSAPVYAKRWGGGGGSRRGGNTRPKSPPQPPSRVDTSVNNHFLNSERGSSSSSGTSHRRPNPFSQPSQPTAPKHPVITNGPIGFDKVNSPSASHHPKAPTVQTNGPIGFDKVNSAGNQQGVSKIGFDKVNSEVQRSPGNSHAPSAPPYPGAPNGPPPPYYTGTHSGAADHPPAYPGRPVNAPPSYSANNPYNGQTNMHQPGFGSQYPNQQHPYPGQNYPGQQGFGNNYGSSYPQQNQFGGVGHGSYPQQNQFGGVGHGSYPSGGSSYPSQNVFYPMAGNSFGGSYPHSNSYQGNNYGGSPFGNTGYNGNPYYNPNNFGFSNNPGYFGSQGGYSGYNGQYDNHKKSRFGGLPIPIPIPIPIPLGGGGFGGLGGFGGFGGYSHNHRLLDSFLKKQNNTQSGNSSTSVFILNNSTVTPCTTDHFVYDLLKVSVMSCTAEHCTAIKLYTTTNISNVVSVHSAGVTMCSENNVTYSYYGENVTPTVSDMKSVNFTVCRNISTNATTNVNETAKTEETTSLAPTTLDTTTAQETTTGLPTTNTSAAVNMSKVCDNVECSYVTMCLPAIEIMDQCSTADCPFKRTGFKPCVTIKMCRSPSTPVSTFATLNTTISKIDEYNNHNSVYDAANLTLISYHRPVINFNCPQNSTAPGCPSPSTNPPPACLPPHTVSDGSSATLCSPATPSQVNSTTIPAVSAKR